MKWMICGVQRCVYSNIGYVLRGTSALGCARLCKRCTLCLSQAFWGYHMLLKNYVGELELHVTVGNIST